MCTDIMTYELIVGNLLSKNKVSWGSGTVTRDESLAFRHVSVVCKVVISLDSTRSDITVAYSIQKA